MATVDEQGNDSKRIALPAPTVWPFVTALGLALLAAGVVTQAAISMVGLIFAASGATGWFRAVLPVEEQERVPERPLEERPRPVVPAPRAVEQLEPGVAGHRVRIPAEIHPYSSGIKGGIVGGIGMAVVACLYGLIAYRSLWYPINLLAAVAVPALAQADVAQLSAFNGTGFIVALISHGVFSILVGLLFAVLLPMLPSRLAAFWGSLTAPLLWSALIWATLRLINPALNARIDWIWFIASQVVFGLTTGYVVHHSKTVETMQTWPLAARAGLETPGLMGDRGEKEE